jgi:hypothetical protein
MLATAECTGSYLQRDCLIGTWNDAGDGSAQPVSRNVHILSVSHNSQLRINISFRVEGLFATRDVDICADVAARNSENANRESIVTTYTRAR